MSGRIAGRYISRRFSSGGKVLSEEEKAAEKVYIQKMEHEKMEKLARQGPKAAAETGAKGAEAPVTDANPRGADPSTSKVSTDKYKNYAVVAGTITALGAIGWYLKSGSKKTEQVHD